MLLGPSLHSRDDGNFGKFQPLSVNYKLIADEESHQHVCNLLSI